MPWSIWQGKQCSSWSWLGTFIPTSYNWQQLTDTYELVFPSNNTLTFGKVALGSGLIDNPASPQFKGRDPAWIAQRMNDQMNVANGSFNVLRPVNIDVRYNGSSYATLSCGYLCGGSTERSCNVVTTRIIV